MKEAESIYTETYSFVLPCCVAVVLMEKALMQIEGAKYSLCPSNTKNREVTFPVYLLFYAEE